jgi:hypothetical protein
LLAAGAQKQRGGEITFTHTRRGDHYALLACFFVLLPLQF